MSIFLVTLFLHLLPERSVEIKLMVLYFHFLNQTVSSWEKKAKLLGEVVQTVMNSL